MNTPIAALLSRKSSDVYSVAVTASVADAVRVMTQNKIGSVLVMQSGELAGIFTERDVITRVLASGRMPESTRMVTVMTDDPLTVTPQTSVEDVMAIFTEHRCRHLPVVQEDGAVIGIISIGDVTRWTLEEHRAEVQHLRQYITGAL